MIFAMNSLIATLVIYQVLLLSIGWWASKRTADNEDFYLGGRKLGAAVAALSASASSSSAWSLLGVSGAAYAWGLPAIWLIPSTLLHDVDRRQYNFRPRNELSIFFIYKINTYIILS